MDSTMGHSDIAWWPLSSMPSLQAKFWTFVSDRWNALEIHVNADNIKDLAVQAANNFLDLPEFREP